MPRMRYLLAMLTLVLTSCASATGVDGSVPTVSTVPVSTSSTTTSMPATTTTTGPRPDVCDPIDDGTAIGIIAEPALSEVSGIVRTSIDPDRLWAHNDSGAPPRLWAVALDGTVLGYHEVRARNVDWEDIALGPGLDGTWWVFLGDIGDNLGRRSGVWLHRFPEPEDVSGTVEDVESLHVTYPGDPADAEALLVDPLTGDAFVITKTASGRSTVLRIPVGAWAQDATIAEVVATVDLGALSFVTGADVSADGSVIAVRTYGDVWLWERDPGESIGDAIRGRPCRAPAPAEPQGEAIALVGSGYVTVSEGEGATVFRFEG